MNPVTARIFSSEMLVEAIARILREDGWTCEYHEPTSAQGECEQCDRAHDATARRIATMAIPTRPADKMNPMTQEPDPTIEAVILKERIPFPGTSGYTFAQRDPSGEGWYMIANVIWSRWRGGGFRSFEGWWPLDYKLMVDQ